MRLARRSTEQAEHRLPQPTPLQIPQRAIDGANAQHGVALPAMDHDAVHLVPQLFMRGRILAENDRAQPPRDE